MGLPHVWNIDAHVGDQRSENRATDVELMKLLIKSALDFGRGAEESHSYESNPPLTLNGAFDQTLAFWIYRLQFTFGIEPKDGKVSPVRRAGTGMLLQLNYQMRLRNALFWADLAAAPGISFALRTEMARRV